MQYEVVERFVRLRGSLFAYLGTTTWFWRVEVEVGEGADTVTGVAVVMRVPMPAPPIGTQPEPPVFRVVEWRTD